MLERIPTVLTSQEILDKAFHKAAKVEIYDMVKYHRIRKTEAARITSATDSLFELVSRYPRAFPNLDNMRTYQTEILDILIGLPELKKSLGSVRWAAGKIREIGRQAHEKLGRGRDIDAFFNARKYAYGRWSSILKEIEPDLALLSTTRDRIRALPTVSPDYATVVLAGFPNVGKSSLLRQWTNAKPEIANYSFTTKQAEVGHFQVADHEGVKTQYQVVDTPGLLDRPDEDRNDVERQAIAALRHAADAVIFLIDASQTSGWSLEQQESLLEQTRAEMAGVPFIVAESKCDIFRSDSGRIKFSPLTGEGVPELQLEVLKLLRFDEVGDLEIDPLDLWHKPEVDEWDD
ncbi:MAG: NOG1 family protein [Thermoplasmatota archaeon]